MTNPLSSNLARRPLLTAVVYTGTCLLPLALVSAQILQLEEDIGFRVGQLGLATAAYFGAAALGANPAGRVVARLGPGRSLRIGALLTLAACVIAGTAVIWWLIPLATAVGGMGNGLTQVASNLAIFDGVARERQGVGFGAKQAAVPLASVLAGISLPVIGLVFGWRWAFVLAGLIALILAVSAPHLDMARAAARNEGPIGRPPKSLIFLAIGGIAGAMGGNGLSLFVVPSAVDIGIGEAAAGAVLAGCSLLVVLVRLGAGWLVDRNESIGFTEMAWMTAAGAFGAFVLFISSYARPLSGGNADRPARGMGLAGHHLLHGRPQLPPPARPSLGSGALGKPDRHSHRPSGRGMAGRAWQLPGCLAVRHRDVCHRVPGLRGQPPVAQPRRAQLVITLSRLGWLSSTANGNSTT